MPSSLVSTYAIGDALAASRSTGWQSTTWQRTTGEHTLTHRSATYTHTATFTHSSTTITRTFTHSSRTFSHTFGASVTITTTSVFPTQAPCYPGNPGCPGYPYYYYTTYYQPPPSYCYPGTPGYPYNCYPGYPYQTVTTVSYQTVTAVPTYSTSMTGEIPLAPVNGEMAHDIWLIITPLPEGQFAVTLSAQGLQQNGGYLIEGVTRATPTATVPIATTAADSEFVAEVHGNGIYWHVLTSDPRVTYGEVLLIYLPNMQIQGSKLVASAYLG